MQKEQFMIREDLREWLASYCKRVGIGQDKVINLALDMLRAEVEYRMIAREAK